MTPGEERAIWSRALSTHGAQQLEHMICGYLNLLSRDVQIGELPGLVSTEGMAQLAGILLANIESGERQVLGIHRTMNRLHFRVLRQTKRRLTFLLLSDLPIDCIPSELRRLKAQIDLGV